jgi:hypothetical protein
MRIWSLAAIALLLVAAPPGLAQPDSDHQRAPFTDIRFEDGDAPLIEVDGRWYRWLALDDIPIDRIEAGASQIVSNRTDREYWQKKRMAEDLVAVLAAIEHTPGETVRLRVAPLDDQLGVEGVRTLVSVPMTHENRSAVRDLRAAREDLNAAREREAEFAGYGAPAALQELAAVVAEHHAYAQLKGLDAQALVEEELARLGEAPERREAILAAHRIVCRLGDGHASIRYWHNEAPPGRLNVLFQRARAAEDDAAAGLVAFRRAHDARRGELLVEGYPFVVSMDGAPIERWLEAAAAYVTDGSEALVSRRSAELLRYINLLRDELGLPHNPEVEFVLRSPDGRTTRVIEPVTSRRAIYGIWPRPAPELGDHHFSIRRLPQNVVHVRLYSMGGEEDAAALRSQLEQMLDVDGIIIDVRGNGGGQRAHIRALLPVFMPEDARVVNIAARRLPRTQPCPPEGWLANRNTFPLTWDGWSDPERAAIEAAMADFMPEWSLPDGQFSDWHAMVVPRKPGDARYEGPVVILMDEQCFSATDIFVGAFKGVEGVTLMGSPSAGGSARSNWHDLEALGAEVRLATMASFQPDGRLYDSNGIEPDAAIEPTVNDLLGNGDTLLDAALRHIATARR